MTRGDDPERERGDRIQELLDALEQLPATRHEGYLAEVCPDPELRREVLSLLTTEQEARDYLAWFAEGLIPPSAEPPDLTGKRIGAYRLLRPLGHGGMGVVYEAERADGTFEQHVALKLLTAALAGTEAHERFLAERQILAGLEHPAIAHTMDGGVTPDGTPWFAMEYVDGEAIDVYCDRQRLGIRQRLELFIQVCDAVEHAHRRLVVHRDLKPANILVTEEQRIKLLDFGIAKLLSTVRGSRATPLTRTGQRLMTPEYASPEQVRGEPLTTASDVYQLGLLLYRLLTGRWPYTVHHGSQGELERVICEQTPTRPSATVSREAPREPSTPAPITGVEELCRERRTSPTRLRRRLRGDLDNIVLKALRKEPERRYGSADRLAQDVRRYLEGLPVTARRDTAIYRGRKFLERHAVGATATATVLCVALALAGLHSVRIQSERDRAEAEATKAKQVSQFLTRLFESSDPREARGAELTARELLDRGVTQVDRELASQPEVHAEMLRVLGRTYLELGLYDAAERLLSRSLESHRSRLPPDRPSIAGTLADIGLLRYRQGDYERSRELLEEAAGILEASPGGDTPELAQALGTLGAAYRELGAYERARSTLERALTIQRRATGRDSMPTAAILRRLGGLLVHMGALERAERLYERALAVYERELETDHPQIGATLVDLASVRAIQGKLDGVEAMYRRSLAILRKAYGPAHDQVSPVLNNLGNFLMGSERYDEAIAVLEEALAVDTEVFGPRNPRVAATLASLGEAHSAGGRLEEARSYFQRSVAAREQALGADRFDPLLFHSLVHLGRTATELGDGVAAERALQRAATLWQQAPETANPQLVPALLYLGRWLSEQQRCAEAVSALQLVARILTAQQPAPDSQLADLERLLAACS